MKLQPIENVDGFQKDENNGAVLSVDNRALYAYKAKKSKQHEILNDINDIKQDLKELKEILNHVISSYANVQKL